MLWQKGWLETRFRLLFMLGFLVFWLVFFSIAAKTPAGGAKTLVGFVEFSIPSFVVMICAMLAGAGINTQPALQATKGLHGSTLFTLSLPVSRIRLVAVRASLGWLEMVGVTGALCSGMWIVFPVLRGMVTAAQMLEYAETLIACTSGLYSITILLATFLDDQWRMWGTMIASAALWWLPAVIPLPASVNIFRAMGEGSPLVAHSMPWPAMAFSLAVAAALFFAALKIVQRLEY